MVRIDRSKIIQRLSTIKVDKDWTLFLDRDGVINRRLPGQYVTSKQDFEFLPGVLDSLRYLSSRFATIVVVTNQQGIGKNLMTEEDLKAVHSYMIESIHKNGGRIDGVYFCPKLSTSAQNCRKPKIDMGLWAKRDFPKIKFQKAIMVGDSITDMDFGKRLEMTTVLVGEKLGYRQQNQFVDYQLSDLNEFVTLIQ